MTIRSTIASGITGICAVLTAQAAMAGTHTWRISEAYSNADGTIQFIELHESFNGTAENNPFNVGSTAHLFTFPANGAPGNTAGRYILLATDGFAALPGAPARDYTIPANFFNPAGDTLTYDSGTYDSWTLSFTPDCVNSLHKAVNGTVTTGPNDPTNYGGTSASINACPTCAGDIAPAGGNGAVDVNDLLLVVSHWGRCPPSGPCPGDFVPAGGNGQVDVNDLLGVISHWGPCP